MNELPLTSHLWERELESAAARTPSEDAAHAGRNAVDTCLGCLLSIARILEGQLRIVGAAADSHIEPVSALMAAYYSATHDSVRTKAIGTLAVLARTRMYLADGRNDPPPEYLSTWATIGNFLVDIVEHARGSSAPTHEALVAAINAIIDTYADENAPWDRVYSEQGFQQRLAAALPHVVSVVSPRRIDPG